MQAVRAALVISIGCLLTTFVPVGSASDAQIAGKRVLAWFEKYGTR